MSFIKHLIPKKNSRYKQVVKDHKIFKKYIASCKGDPVIFRSSLELEFINYCENHPSIKRWASEPLKIKYYSRLDGKEMNYYPDFVIEKTNGSRIIVEIKPKSQTYKPTVYDNLWSKQAWVKNMDKWIAAYKFAKEHNMSFIVVSENMQVHRITEDLVTEYIDSINNTRKHKNN